MIKPTKEEYQKYEELKKKITDYEKAKIKLENYVEDIFKNVVGKIREGESVEVVFYPSIKSSTTGVPVRYTDIMLRVYNY